jgi:hypothetical protein
MIRMNVADAEKDARERYAAAVREYETAVADGRLQDVEILKQRIKKCRLELDSLQDLNADAGTFLVRPQVKKVTTIRAPSAATR